uniref:Uncharacterized protein n=1 Tax=Arion vulgaris TaxID=1028688 RepID=A0A0B7A626_9EUPU
MKHSTFSVSDIRKCNTLNPISLKFRGLRCRNERTEISVSELELMKIILKLQTIAW